MTKLLGVAALACVIGLAMGCLGERGDGTGPHIVLDGGGTTSDGATRTDGRVVGGEDSATPFDSGVILDRDAGGQPSSCDPTCMAMSGAVCCLECGCTAAVRCTPVCELPLMWDCEIGCCFDYETHVCG